MNYERGYFSSTITQSGLIVAGGGPIVPPDSPMKKVEVLPSNDINAWTMKNDIPTTNVGSCMSTINERTLLLTGGSNLDPSVVSY